MKHYRASKLTLLTDFDDKSFLTSNHYQGWIPSTLKYGLFDGNELIIEMTFGKPRYSNEYDWELLRLATKKDCQVYGGASRLFKHFLEDHSGSIMSYCNLSLFSGKVYEALGFILKGKFKSYHYEKDGKSYNRIGFQKWKLLVQYPELNPDLTEKEIMTELLGYTLVEETQSTWVFNDTRTHYVYRITNLLNNHTYIGQHIKSRNKDSYMGSGTAIRNAIKKYGLENFVKDIIEDNISTSDINDKEYYYIKLEKENGHGEYNILTGQYQPHTSIGLKHLVVCLETGEVNGKAGWAEKGYPKAYDCARRARTNCKGLHFKYTDDESTLEDLLKWEANLKEQNEKIRREKIAQTSKGRTHTVSEEAREKIRQAALKQEHRTGFHLNEQTKEKLRNAGKAQKTRTIDEIHSMGYITRAELNMTERQKRALKIDLKYKGWACYIRTNNINETET